MFLCQILEVKILKDLHVLKSPVSENHIFSRWSVYMCISVISITQKQITAETASLAFYICIIC